VTYEGDNFVLDQQVVRSALKSYHKLFSSSPPSLLSLSPSSNYLRLLTPPEINVSLSIQDFADPKISIILLELRAALIVQDHAKNLATGDIDASVIQRVSKAVTEAFVAVQVAEMIKGLEDVPRIKGNDEKSLPPLSLDDSRRWTGRFPFFWSDASNSNIQRITVVLK